MEDIFARALALGIAHGHNVGSWVIDGNTSDETKRRIIVGYNDCDPEVMDIQPSPLSGEWGGDPSPSDILTELGTDEDDNAADDLLTEYESGFSQGYWAEVMRSAQATLSDA